MHSDVGSHFGITIKEEQEQLRPILSQVSEKFLPEHTSDAQANIVSNVEAVNKAIRDQFMTDEMKTKWAKMMGEPIDKDKLNKLRVIWNQRMKTYYDPPKK